MPDVQSPHPIIAITIWTGVLLALLMIYGIITTSISFGEGPGDTFYMMTFTLTIFGTAVSHSVLKGKVEASHPIHALLAVMMVVYLMVMLGFLTYWRGGASSWNGELLIN